MGRQGCETRCYGEYISFRKCKHLSIWFLYRLARIYSIYMRYMVSPRHPISPLYLLSTPLSIRIHLQPLPLQRMNHHLSVSYVLAHLVRSFFYLVATLSRVKNAPLIWSNSALEVQSCTRRSLLRPLNHSLPRLPKHPLSMTLDLQP